MSVKQVEVKTPGGVVTAHVGLDPDTTAMDVLNEVGLGKGFFLSPATGKSFFQRNDKLDSLVKDGDVLYANPWAKVGSQIWILAVGIPLSILFVMFIIYIINGLKRYYKPTNGNQHDVNNSLKAYWKQSGWRNTGNWYYGKYLVNGHKMQGEIQFTSKWEYDFRILAPKKLISACGLHCGCFIPKSKIRIDGYKWYNIHFTKNPETIASGIAAIEKMLACADEKIRRKVGAA